MADDVFKLPQSSYDTVCKIIQAYGEIGEKTNLATISRMLGTDPTLISRNIGFLVAVGLLEGGRDKGPTAAGAKLGRALQFENVDDIRSAWREVLSGHPLIQRTLAAIRVRGGMEATALQTQIVYTAGVNKNSGTLRGGAAVLEMMKAANLVAERDGSIIAVQVPDAPPLAAEDDEDFASAQLISIPATDRVLEVRRPSGLAISIELNVTIAVKPEELPTLGSRIKEMLDQLEGNGEAYSEEGTSGDLRR